jgi:hypothetical protein
MWHPLWREDGSVVYICYCLHQRSHSQVRFPRGSWPHFTVSNLRIPKPGRPGPCIYIPQEKGGSVIPPGTGLLTTRFRRILEWVSELYYDRRSVGQSVLVSSPHLVLMTRFLLLSDTCGFVDMGRHLWREDGSVFYNCCCLRQRSHSQVRVPRGSWPHFTVSHLRLPKPGGPGLCIYIPQEQGGSVIPPRHMNSPRLPI